MFDNFQRFTGLLIDQWMLCFVGYLLPEFIDNVAGMCHILWNFKFASGSFFEVVPYFFQFRRKFLPGFDDFVVNAKRGNARNCEVLITGFGHQGKLPCCDGLYGVERNNVRMITDT